jgi:hypothetical protein
VSEVEEPRNKLTRDTETAIYYIDRGTRAFHAFHFVDKRSELGLSSRPKHVPEGSIGGHVRLCAVDLVVGRADLTTSTAV